MRFDYNDDDDSTANQTALYQPPELDVRAADAIAYELESGAEFVAWIPEWLIDSNQIVSSDHHAQVVAGDVEAETEKAVFVATSFSKAWLPKSQIRVFERADDAGFMIAGVHDEAAEE